MSTANQVPSLADIQRAEAELAAQDQQRDQEIARQQKAADDLARQLEALTGRVQELTGAGADVGVVAVQVATTRVPPLELGSHVEAALRARWAAVQARKQAGTKLQQLVAERASALEAASEEFAGYKAAMDEAEKAVRANKEAEAARGKKTDARRAEALAAAHPTITGEVIRPEVGAAATLAAPATAAAVGNATVPDLVKRPAAPPPAPEGYEPTGMHRASPDAGATLPPAPPPAAAKPAPKPAQVKLQPVAAPTPAKPARPSGREATRVKMEASVDMESESNFFTGFSTDISAGGLFVATVDLHPIGSEIDLHFTLPSGQAVNVQGVVRWRRELNDQQPEIFPGMGVQFQTLTPQATAVIQQFVGTREPLFFPD